MSENSVNKVDLSGYVQNAVLRQTLNSNAVCNFSIALVSSSKKGTERKTYLRAVAWKSLALRVAELPKQCRVRVRGRLEVAAWTDKQTGEKKSRVQIICDELEPVAHLQQPPSQKEIATRPIDDSDIPF